MAKKQKNINKTLNSDAAALGNTDVRTEVEVRSGALTEENSNNLHDDPDFYIGQEADETK